MDGDTLVLGAQLKDAEYGTAYVYHWDGTAWIEQAKLYPHDRFNGGGQGFGYSVAVDGDQHCAAAGLCRARPERAQGP